MDDHIRRSPPSLAELRRHRGTILRLAQRHGAREVRVFGSVARGDADTHGDVDFLVEMDAGRSLLDLDGLLMDLQDLLDGPVDVVTPASLATGHEHASSAKRYPCEVGPRPCAGHSVREVFPSPSGAPAPPAGRSPVAAGPVPAGQWSCSTSLASLSIDILQPSSLSAGGTPGGSFSCTPRRSVPAPASASV